MKTKFIIILILLIPVFGFSQINQSFDFVSGIEYSYRNLTTSSEDKSVKWILESRDNEESGKLNWRVGFNYNRRLTDKIFLRTGLRLASVGYKGEKIVLRWGSDDTDPNLPHEIQFVYDYWFAEIPIAGRFEMNRKKISPFFELGISPSIYLIQRTKTITDIKTETQFQNNNIDGFKKVHIVGFISFGVNYTINDKFQLFGQPIFRYHLTELVDAPIVEHLFNYGIEIGIRRKLK